MIGSHDTMSYLPSRCRLLKPFRLFATCQDKCLNAQWESGVRYFDLRVRYSNLEDGTLTFAHGFMPYETYVTLEDVLLFLETRAVEHPMEIVCFRTVYEIPLPSDLTAELTRFKADVEKYLKKFTHLKFCGAYVKTPWKELLPPTYKVRYVDCYGNTFPWIPRFWAWHLRKLTLAAIKLNCDSNDTVVMTDFV